MARTVDVRIPSTQSGDAVRVLAAAFNPMTFVIDTNPSASGEVELQIEARSEAEIRGVLDSAGVPVLAIRTRLSGELADRFGTRIGTKALESPTVRLGGSWKL